MEQFSSCYFCGDAVDASLDEYPVVPASVDPEAGERRTIVLCTTCKRKLDPVVEAVIDAVGDDALTIDRSGSDIRKREDAGSGSDDRREGSDTEKGSTTTDIGSTLGDDEDVLRSVGDEDDETHDADGTASGQSPGNEDIDAESERTDEDDSAKRSYTSGQRAGGRPSDGNRDDSDDEDDRKRDVTMTRLENTNVMRMMQNREFPVDRDDFVTVASSAYEISPDRCEKVLDLAIKHDLLREQDGQLNPGANWS